MGINYLLLINVKMNKQKRQPIHDEDTRYFVMKDNSVIVGHENKREFNGIKLLFYLLFFGPYR